jgi:hypothetical protein
MYVHRPSGNLDLHWVNKKLFLLAFSEAKLVHFIKEKRTFSTFVKCTFQLTCVDSSMVTSSVPSSMCGEIGVRTSIWGRFDEAVFGRNLRTKPYLAYLIGVGKCAFTCL